MTAKVHQQVFFTSTPASAAETDAYFLCGILNWKSPEWEKNNKLIENYKKAPSLRRKRGCKLSTRRAWSSRGEQKPTQIKSSSISLLKGKNCISFRRLKHEKRRRRQSRKKAPNHRFSATTTTRFYLTISSRARALALSLSLSLSSVWEPGPKPRNHVPSLCGSGPKPRNHVPSLCGSGLQTHTAWKFEMLSPRFAEEAWMG